MIHRYFFTFWCIFSTIGAVSNQENATIDNGSKLILRLPKCCPMGSSVSSRNCTKNTNIDFEPKFSVHKHTDEAFDDEPISLTEIIFTTYNHNPCNGNKFPLFDEDEPKFLLNGSLMITRIAEYRGLLNQEEYCIDTMFNPNGDKAAVYPFVCVRERNFPEWLIVVYLIFSALSALLFILASIYFYRQGVQSIQKKSFICYSLSMSLTYIFTILLQFIDSCNFLGLLLQFSMTLSFTWTAILCFDLAWNIYNFGEQIKPINILVYIAVSLIYAGCFLLKSIVSNFTPDIPIGFFKPQFKKNSCLDINWEQHTEFFYLSSLIPVIFSSICLIYVIIKMNHLRYYASVMLRNKWKVRSPTFRLRIFECFLIATFLIICRTFGNLFWISYEYDLTIDIYFIFIESVLGFVFLKLTIFLHYFDSKSDADFDRRSSFELDPMFS